MILHKKMSAWFNITERRIWPVVELATSIKELRIDFQQNRQMTFRLIRQIRRRRYDHKRAFVDAANQTEACTPPNSIIANDKVTVV